MHLIVNQEITGSSPVNIASFKYGAWFGSWDYRAAVTRLLMLWGSIPSLHHQQWIFGVDGSRTCLKNKGTQFDSERIYQIQLWLGGRLIMHLTVYEVDAGLIPVRVARCKIIWWANDCWDGQVSVKHSLMLWGSIPPVHHQVVNGTLA